MSTHEEMKCNPELLRLIQYNLGNFKTNSRQIGTGKKAAVAITVVDLNRDGHSKNTAHSNYSTDASSVIITTRSSSLKNHAGQWALPGGKIDTGEKVEETALRELYEEVGLKLRLDSVIGYLDDFVTRSGFVITPVVIWGGQGQYLTPNLQEVNSVYRIPIEELLKQDAPILEYVSASRNLILYMSIGWTWVAAPTAAILYQFREVAIMGNNARVDHFEQPYFAWK